MKKFVLLFGFLFLLSFSSALQLGVSPAHLNLSIGTNQKVCSKVIIDSDKQITINLEDKWNKIQNKNLSEYNFSAKEVGMEIFFPKSFLINGNKEIEICFLSKKSGKYYGIIFYSGDGFAGVGQWVEIKTGYNFLPNSLTMTGATIGVKKSNIKYFFLGLTFFLELSLLYLLLKLKNKSRNKLV